MVKVLVFENDDQSRDRFAFLYQGLCNSTKTQVPRELARLKAEGSVRKKLEAISTADAAPDGRFKYTTRTLREAAIVELDADEIAILIDYVPAVAWTMAVADLVADAVEWVSVAPEKSAYEKAKATA